MPNWNDFRHAQRREHSEANGVAEFTSSYVVRRHEGDQRAVTFNGVHWTR